MASLTRNLTIIAVVFLGLLSISANARPCKTLLISTYSISFKPTFHRQNPNFLGHQQPQPLEPQGFVTIFTSSSSSSSSSRFFIDRPNFLRPYPVAAAGGGDNHEMMMPRIPQFRPAREEDESSFGMFDSLRDRTKDLLSVVFALLFGVGCGALTAGTMYMAYSLVKAFYHPRPRFYFDDSSDDDEEVEEDVFSPKKGGYVKIPSPTDAAPPLKQVDIAIQPSVNKD